MYLESVGDFCRQSCGEYSYTVVKTAKKVVHLSALKKVATYMYFCTKYMAATLTSTNMEIVSISSIRHDVDWCLIPYDPPIIFSDSVWLGRVGCRVASKDDSLIERIMAVITSQKGQVDGVSGNQISSFSLRVWWPYRDDWVAVEAWDCGECQDTMNNTTPINNACCCLAPFLLLDKAYFSSYHFGS